MSLSNPTLTNPAEHFFEWKGGDGKVQFYDKEKQENITVPLPFEFIVLDELHTVTGYSDQDQSGFWSNEVRNLREDFTVRTKRGVKYVGPYKNDQGIVQVPQGARYTKSIYIAHPNKAGELILGHLKLTGAALTAWIDFNKQHSTSSGKVRLTGSTEGKKGATTYQIPTFEWQKWTDEEYQSAVILDKLLQQYLSQYLTAPKYDDNAEPVSDDMGDSFNTDDGKATPEQIEEFERLKAQKMNGTAKHSGTGTTAKTNDEPLPPEPTDTFNDDTFDPSEIPF